MIKYGFLHHKSTPFADAIDIYGI